MNLLTFAPIQRFLNRVFPHTRAHPIQRDEAAHWIYAPAPEQVAPMLRYVLNNWVYTAVSRLAESAASAEVLIVDRATRINRTDEHGLLDLIGRYGHPNDAQDSFEFLEQHFTNLDVSGNSYWYWFAGSDGLPGEVHLLDPSRVQIVPGTDRTVSHYVYGDFGRFIEISPLAVTHFKKPNPYSRYYGLSALHALEAELRSERSMIEWNRDFFSEEVRVPSGVFVLPASTSDAEVSRVERMLSQKLGRGKRETAVIRASGEEGAQVQFVEAGLKPRDIDFENGRLLTRRSVYEALGLPMGIMSEASTEAHATVAERRYAEAIEIRHLRTEAKVNADAMTFWPRWNSLTMQFEDIKQRSMDWRRESLKLNSLGNYMTVDEVRTQVLNLAPMKKGDVPANANKSSTKTSVPGGSGGDPRPLRIASGGD